MSDGQTTLLVTWATITIVLWVITWIEYGSARSVEEKRRFARLFLMAPVWFVPALLWVVRVVPRAIGRLFFDATRIVD